VPGTVPAVHATGQTSAPGALRPVPGEECGYLAAPTPARTERTTRAVW
jgi:hypothetical protein